MWVLRFRLMVERGPHSRPQASEGEAQHGPFCRTRRIGRIGDQAAASDVEAGGVDRWQLVPRRKRDDQVAMDHRRLRGRLQRAHNNPRWLELARST